MTGKNYRRVEHRKVVIEMDFKIPAPQGAPAPKGRGGQRDDAEMRRFILNTLRHELTREGQR